MSTDLSALTRSAANPTSQPASVPRPPRRLLTRLVLPAAMLLATVAILAYAARDALQPLVPVHVATAIPMPEFAVPSGEPDSPPHPTDDPAERARGPVVVQAPGRIEPAPFAISVPALAEGVVTDVLVLEGQTVEAGQVVARLLDDDARLAVRAAEAALGEREADVERAAAAVQTAESQVRVEQIGADELRDEVTRKRELVAGGGLSPGEFRRMEIRLSGLEAKVATSERLANEARAARKQAESALTAAQVLKDEAQLRLSRMEVRSPVAGTVLARLVEPGSRVSMGGKGGAGESGGTSMSGTVLRVYDPSKLQVRVDVPLAESAKVGVGSRATVTTEALPDQTFTGEVSRIMHEANIQRNSLEFKVSLDSTSPFLKPEMLTRVKLHGPAGRSNRGSARRATSGGDPDIQTLLIPAAAITATGEGKGQVWTVDATGGAPVASRREITFDPPRPANADGMAMVSSGLRLTDRVILDAPSKLGEGSRLRILDGSSRDAPQPAAENE